MAKLTRNQFKFMKHQPIGAEGAEDDDAFLAECFVDTGELAALRDAASPKRVVVGRTGVGKTALLMELRRREERLAWLEPEQLALSYLVNSTILRHLTDLGVDLDIFYKLLWRHIFVVELIQLKYGLKTEKDQQSFLSNLTNRLFGDKRKKEALDYLSEWGSSFWKETETRVHEVIDRLSAELSAKFGVKAEALQSVLESRSNQSQEVKTEVMHKAQSVIESLQVQKLARVVDTLAEEVFNTPFPHYFIVIDKLDEAWIGDTVKLRLIRALLETVRELKKFKSAKIVIAVRTDLLGRVFRETRDFGFQEEKYQPLILQLTWKKSDLLQVIDRRLNVLVRRQYTKEPVEFFDLFPRKIGKSDSQEYLVKRTLFRPRDIIQFINCCILLADGSAEVTQGIVRDAEKAYSAHRLRSLSDEWSADYPKLIEYADLLKKRPPTFRVHDIEDERVMGLLGRCASEDVRGHGRAADWLAEYFDNQLTANSVKCKLVYLLYEVGILGLRLDQGSGVSWSFLDPEMVREAELGEATRAEICPMFYRVLSTEDRFGAPQV